MAAPRYNEVLADLKKQGRILDYELRAETNWIGSDDPTAQHFTVVYRLLNSEDECDQFEDEVKQAMPGHFVSFLTKENYDLNVYSDDGRWRVECQTTDGADFMRSYTRANAPAPLDYTDRRFSAWPTYQALTKEDNAYVETMVTAAKTQKLLVIF